MRVREERAFFPHAPLEGDDAEMVLTGQGRHALRKLNSRYTAKSDDVSR